MKNYFEPVTDTILSSHKHITKMELHLISKSISEAESIIELCNVGPQNDNDVLDYYDNYLTKCIERLQRSLKQKQNLKIVDLKKV